MLIGTTLTTVLHYRADCDALRHGSHSFTCKLNHACLYSPPAEHHRSLAGTNFTVPRRLEGWVDLGGWLHIEIKCRLRESNPDTVTHLSTIRAQRRLTSLIETNDAATSATPPPHRTEPCARCGQLTIQLGWTSSCLSTWPTTKWYATVVAR